MYDFNFQRKVSVYEHNLNIVVRQYDLTFRILKDIFLNKKRDHDIFGRAMYFLVMFCGNGSEKIQEKNGKDQ